MIIIEIINILNLNSIKMNEENYSSSEDEN